MRVWVSFNKVWNDVRVCVRVWVSFNKVAKSPWSLNLSWPLQVNWVLDLLVGYKICWYLVFLASQLGFGFASWFWDLLIFGVGFETPWPWVVNITYTAKFNPKNLSPMSMSLIIYVILTAYFYYHYLMWDFTHTSILNNLPFTWESLPLFGP